MNITKPILTTTAALLLSLLSAPALTCSLIPPGEHRLNPALVGVDTQAPAAIAPPSVSVQRGVGPMSVGCSYSSSSCDDLGFISLVINPPGDDQTPPDEIGYQLMLVSGALPSESALPEGPIRPQGSELVIRWIDGAEDEQEPFRFTLDIFPVDTAGNVGEPTRVTISDPGSSGGCKSGPGATGSLTPLLLLWLAWGLRRRVTAT